ncbi:hypothetical protein EJB05_52569, partial [Eragrostis curvula]
MGVGAADPVTAAHSGWRARAGKEANARRWWRGDEAEGGPRRVCQVQVSDRPSPAHLHLPLFCSVAPLHSPPPPKRSARAARHLLGRNRISSLAVGLLLLVVLSATVAEWRQVVETRPHQLDYPWCGCVHACSVTVISSSVRDRRGVCIMSNSWRDKQHPNLINFIAAFLAGNSYRLSFRSLSPDFIFNNGGVSVAFIFETCWDPENEAAVFSRVNTLKRQFKHLYVVVTVPTNEQHEAYIQSYFKYGMEFGCPTFVPVLDPEMGFEKIVKIAHARGVCKQQDIVSTMKNEREQAVQCMDAFLRVLTSIPGIDSHDANALAQAIGSIEAISKASKGFILENTDLSTDKAERVVRFFRDPQYYLSPKIN